MESALKIYSDRTAAAKADSDFMGVTFGVGFGFSAGSERVTAAEPGADGTLRATKTVRHEPRVILESHYYAWCPTNREECYAGKRGFGPFFGIAATNDTITSFALGLMLGWRDPGSTTDSRGYSFGIGAVLDAEVESLAPGFEVGKPLPSGETVAKFQKKSKWSPLLFFTRTF